MRFRDAYLRFERAFTFEPETLVEWASVVAIAIIAWWVYQRTGYGMLELIMNNVPELLERK